MMSLAFYAAAAACVLAFLVPLTDGAAFHSAYHNCVSGSRRQQQHHQGRHRRQHADGDFLLTTALHDTASSPDLLLVKDYLATNYPSFHSLLQQNDAVWKALGGSNEGFTVFAPNEAAFAALGNTRIEQIKDPRNLETAEKIGAYHVIAETVTATALFEAGGVITMGGEVPIERTVVGGMFGMGGKEDGSVTVNGAKVTQSVELGNGVLHETDALISPQLLWRYMDQLRIPGSN